MPDRSSNSFIEVFSLGSISLCQMARCDNEALPVSRYTATVSGHVAIRG